MPGFLSQIAWAYTVALTVVLPSPHLPCPLILAFCNSFFWYQLAMITIMLNNNNKTTEPSWHPTIHVKLTLWLFWALSVWWGWADIGWLAPSMCLSPPSTTSRPAWACPFQGEGRNTGTQYQPGKRSTPPASAACSFANILLANQVT